MPCILFLHGIFVLLAGGCLITFAEAVVSCQNLQLGQFYCESLELMLDNQLPPNFTCQPNNSALVPCQVIEGLECDGLVDDNGTFYKPMPCQHSHGKDWRIALILSIFFGWLGFDRFYLGYIGIGLLKLCTFGFFLIFHLTDVILIALQVVQPADGSAYNLDFYGPRAIPVNYDNKTVL